MRAKSKFRPKLSRPNYHQSHHLPRLIQTMPRTRRLVAVDVNEPEAEAARTDDAALALKRQIEALVKAERMRRHHAEHFGAAADVA